MAEDKVRISVSLPENVVKLYEETAAKNGRTLEDELAERLKRCRLYTAGRPIYFNDSERNELERITGGHQLKTAQDALEHIRKAITVDVSNVKVEIDGRLMQRVLWRAKAERKTVGEFVTREVLHGIQAACGMR